MAEIPVVTPEFVSGKKVLLRYDLDVITDGQIDDFRLKAGLPTLKMCLEHASSVTMIGHVGRPGGKEVEELSVTPIYQWLLNQGFRDELQSKKLQLLENLRFDRGEEAADEDYARDLIHLTGGDVFVNEAFAAHHKAASTTVLPTLLPHSAGLNFAKEVYELKKIKENPQKPLVAIIGGVKIEDKLSAILALAKIADSVIVGGRIAEEIREVSENVLVARLNEEGTDLSFQTIESWKEIIRGAKMIIWNGPLGKVDSGQGTVDRGTEQGTYKVAEMILESQAEVIIGGGDTVGFLEKANLLDKLKAKGFISTGGGAMLKFLSEGTLPTIEALN